MLFKIGLVLMIFVTAPVFIIGALIYLVDERGSDDTEDEPEVCGNCNHCFMDFGVWRCFNKFSLWYEDTVDPDEDGCSEWESDSE